MDTGLALLMGAGRNAMVYSGKRCKSGSAKLVGSSSGPDRVNKHGAVGWRKGI